MRAIAGAIVLLAGAVLFAAGILADAITRDHGNYGNAGYILGVILGLIGIAMIVSNPLRRVWDAIPVDRKQTVSSGSGSGA